MTKVRREDVLEALATRGLIEQPVTTKDVAEWLGVEEYAVRGAISWLCVAGVLEVVGSVRRTDPYGRPYEACVYYWHGQMVIPHVPRRREDRVPQAEWDVGCFNILMGAICKSKRRAA